MHSLHNGLVTVRIFSNIGGTELEIEPSGRGYLGPQSPGSALIMRLKIDRTKADYVVAITTNRSKAIAFVLDEVRRDGELVFEHEVPVTDKGIEAEGNLVRLIVMSNKGQVVSKNVAIISQKGNCYVAPALTYKGQVYRNPSGKAVCPDFEDKGDGKGSFTGVLPLIERHYTSNYALPSLSSRREPVFPSAELIEQLENLETDHHLIVTSWSLSSSTGVAITKDRTLVKLYASDINVADRDPAYLEEGEIIVADRLGRPVDRRVRLPLQAFGVTRTEEIVTV